MKNDVDEKDIRIWKIAGAVFLILAIVCGALFCRIIYRQRQAQEIYEQLAGQTSIEIEPLAPVDIESYSSDSSVEEPPAAPEEKDPMAILKEMGVPIPEKAVDFAELQKTVNRDIYAWIYIPDSKIDYPVLRHPTDNYYYLNHNLDGSRGYPGCIYSENYNKQDFSDPNTVLYGHNMKNGTMFAGLHKFGDSEYFDTHPYVYIYMPEKLYVYEIFAAYTHSNEHLLYTYDFSDSTVFEDYITEIMNTRDMSCNLKAGVEITAEDCILTLSTCISNKPENRYIVQGVLLNEG